jgi:hypothetical protein
VSTRKPRKPAASKKATKKATPPGDGVAEMLAAMRVDLVEYVGRSPTPLQKLVIERACWTNLHLKMLDEKVANGATLAASDRQAYLSLSGALLQSLAALGPPAPGGKIDLENLSDEDLARIIATERAARMSAKRVERVVVETTARQIITSKINRIFSRETVPEDVSVSGEAVATADPLPAAADPPADAPDEPPVAPAPTPHSPPDLRVVVSSPGADPEWPPKDCWRPPPSRLSEDEERAAQKARFRNRVLG